MALASIEKQLTRIGNSYGLIINQSLMRMANIGPTSTVRMLYDGRRLVIEAIQPKHDPSAARRAAARLRSDACIYIANELGNDLKREHLFRLGGDYRFVQAFIASIEGRNRFTPEQELVMDRLEHVFAGVQLGLSLDDAVDRAVELVPSGDPYH